MKRIEEIDKNFAVIEQIPEATVYASVDSPPFKLYGVHREGERYVRLPKATAEWISQGTAELFMCTAGGRLRFATNSEYIALCARLNTTYYMQHLTFLLCAGFDVYRDGEYFYTVKPTMDMSRDRYTAFIPCRDKEMHDYTVVFPCYGGVSELIIGISPEARLCEAAEYKITKPIIYYGSSITQGGCATRPGLTYQELISRRFDADYFNLGFSGKALAEDKMADFINSYIAEKGASAFCYDYDYNAPNVEYLQKTHERFFLKIREKNPDLPIIMLSKHDCWAPESAKRRDIIETTYKNAVSSGDKNVYFIDGADLLTFGDATVDGCHPNDFGFYLMAKRIGDELEKILK